MDGDAFRMAEADVVGYNGPRSCVLGIHVYSDGSLLSWSGGAFEFCRVCEGKIQREFARRTCVLYLRALHTHSTDERSVFYAFILIS